MQYTNVAAHANCVDILMVVLLAESIDNDRINTNVQYTKVRTCGIHGVCAIS